MTWEEFFTELWHAELLSLESLWMFIVLAIVGILFK